MAFKKRKGVLAKPGEYTYGDVTEKKTAEELKKAVDRQPTIMLTRGHPKSGFPSASDFIGTVTQSWDVENERVLGDFWFYEEAEDKIPERVKRKIINNEPVPISAGFAVDDVEDGVQKGLVYTHVAVLDDEEPVCPLDTCGINVRQESSSMPDMRYESKQELTDPDAEAETSKEEQSEETSEPQGPTVSELQAEIAELKELVSELASEDENETDEAESAEQEPEASEESEDNQVEEQKEPEPEPEPEQVIPAGTPVEKYDHLTKNADGTLSWEMPSEET